MNNISALKNITQFFLASIFLFVLFTDVLSQENPNLKLLSLKITYLDTAYNTNDKFILNNSDSLILQNLNLIRGDDYTFDYRNGIIRISKLLFSKYKLDTTRIYDFKVYYDVLPYSFKDVYSNFETTYNRDTVTGDTITIATTSKDFIENLFEGTDLEKSGSIFRGIDFGSNRDLTVNSGFRLQLNGKLSSDIDITAALTDETTPIQPEGNTQKLQELDKVFIELKSSNITATLGDIDINFQKSEFVNFNRKIQGAKGYGDFGIGNVTLTGAVSRGKFNTNKFNGLDGVQGPYRLTGSNNEVNIVILSGTEKVYIDGILLIRGEQADYTIDYGLGQVIFTTKKLITAASRITIDFEYTDKKYSRTLIAFNNKYSLLSKSLSMGISYINESDNPDKPIDFTLNDTDRVILQNAGADKYSATKSGAVFVGRDSLGRSIGTYIKTADSTGYVYYRYAPGDTAAVYNVSFSFVGQGNGEYSSQSSYQFNYVGKKNGSYSPIIFIPIPTSYQIADINLEFSPGKNKNFYFRFEGAYSYFDRNKLSDLDNSNNGGTAILGQIGYKNNNFNFLGINFTGFEISYKQRIIDKHFFSLDRINSVEFNRNFDVQDSTQATEDWKEGNIDISPGKLISLKGSFGMLSRGDFFSSNRSNAAIEFNNPNNLNDTTNLPQFRYSFENVNSDYKLNSSKGNWLKHNALFLYKHLFSSTRQGANLTFTFNFTSETKKNTIASSVGDSLLIESFAFTEIYPRLTLNNIFNFNIFAEYGYRKDDSPNKGKLENLSDAYTQKYGFTYNGTQWLSSLFDITIMDKKYSTVAAQLGNVNNSTVLVNSRTRVSPFNSFVTADLFYNVTSERTAKIEKLFVLVPIGQGNYIYLGDLNGNGIQDENEFQLVNYDGNYIKLNVPTDQLFPTVDLKTSLRVYIKPSRYFYLTGTGFFADLFNNTSTETYIKVDEKSKDPNTDNIYFLRFSTFQNDSNTITGLNFLQQDFNFFENNQAYSLRLRFIQQNGFNQYSSGNERLLNIQRSIKFRLGLTSDVGFQFEYTNKSDRNLAPLNSIRNRNIISNLYNSDFSYKPIPKIESGLEMNFARSDDSYPVVPVSADINQQIFRLTYSFISSGRVRLEFERAEVILSQENANIPYELTNGKPNGKNYYLRVFFDYSISKNIQASVSYDGRSEGSHRVIHTGKAQVTAFF